MLRWVAAGVLEAVKGFRRLKGCGDMPRLVSALRARDQQLGLGVSHSTSFQNSPREIYQRVMADFRMRRHVTQAA